MSFGKSPGPPATRQQLQDLLGLVQAAGHADFRDARGPLGLNQRQAGGKFTRAEAEQLIDELERAEDARIEAGAAASEGAPRLELVHPNAIAAEPADPLLADVDDNRLVAELRRRGWSRVER